MDQSVSAGHLVAIGIAVGEVVVLTPLARFRPGRWLDPATRVLAVLLVANEAGFEAVQWRGAFGFGPWTPAFSLPLYVCDIAALVAAVALIWRIRLCVEIVWYWALAATVQGILTPDHPISFPSYDWLEFYLQHLGVLLAALWLVIGIRLHPRPRAAVKVAVITAVLIGLIGVVDVVTGGDYDYLRSLSPPGLLAHLGPWPWDIVAAAGVGLALIAILDLPFWPERRRARRASMAMSRAVAPVGR